MMKLQSIGTMLFLGTIWALPAPTWADNDDNRFRKDQRREVREQPQPERRSGPAQPPGVVRDRVDRIPPGYERREGVRPRDNGVERRTGPVQPPGTVRGRDDRAPSPGAPVRDWRKDTSVPSQPPKPGYVLDRRYNHNHYYPPRGHIVPTLPPVHREIVYRHEHYFYHDGIWYRPYNSRFIVIFPPIGIIVPFLPPFYTTIWVGPTTYYYAGGVYYAWYPEQRSYVVVEAPPERSITRTESGSDQLFIYPKLGQSEEQQAKDRYECHRWAQSQTGFDPTQPGGGVPEAQHRSKHADYLRAMKACLEARGYSVQ